MLFDAHGDILTDIYLELKKGNENPFQTRHLELYKKGGITHSIFVNFTQPNEEDSKHFDEIFKTALPYILKNDDIFHICLNSSDMIKSASDGKIGIILGIEGIKFLKDINQLRELYDLGFRHASLTWNEENKYASGLDNPNTRGLTNLGIELLNEMQKMEMIVDLAHSNIKTFFEILENTFGPVIISHGNVHKVCNHKRNYTDIQLLAIKERNGVIGICGIPKFLSDNESDQTVQQMVKHIDYAVNLIGIDHVGLGFDFCYYLNDETTDNHVEGLKTIADVNNIFIELKKLGYSEEEIHKIKFGNFNRVIKEILG